MLVILPFGAGSNIAPWRTNIKPPVELVVNDFLKEIGTIESRSIWFPRRERNTVFSESKSFVIFKLSF